MKITIEKHRGLLRLRFEDNGRRCISLGVPDSPVGRALALQRKAQMELDWQIGQFDHSLLKYRPQTTNKGTTEIKACELFRRFTAYKFKEKSLAQSSIDTRYKPIERALEKYLDLPINEIERKQAEEFAEVCRQTVTDSTARARIWLLQSCWEWADGKYRLASKINPWEGIANRFKVSNSQKVKPFSIKELQAILKEFTDHPKHCHYHDFVSFLINTGCRIGEAAGLKWKHLGADYSNAWIGESVTRGVRKSTKTCKARTILLSPALSSMLVARFERLKPNPDDLIFPNQKGEAINDHYFRSRIWKPILVRCSIEYRRPYAMRHSAITNALENGVNPSALAQQTGHDKRVLLDTYDHVIAKKYLFVEV
jgi:integrase